jgi:hypothetical protein
MRKLIEQTERLLTEGGQTFMVTARGATPEVAFRNAVEDARRRYGDDGYTGTIAEKSKFVLINLPTNYDQIPLSYAKEFARSLIDKADRRIDDKWGPSGAIDLRNGEYLFFGWASS